MVHDTDFYTTRRTYSTRPVVSSYTVSYPSVQRYTTSSSRVYTSSYPIYSSYHSLPYVAHKRLVTGTRIVSSPVRVVTSPIRVIRPAVRVIASPIRTVRPYTRTTRVISSPVRMYSSAPKIRFYRESVTPIRVITSPPRTTRTLPSVLNREIDRIQKRIRPTGFGYSDLEKSFRYESFNNFDEETKKIRNSTNNLLKEIHTPVVRRARSATPFYPTRYEPTSGAALDAYVARITNPMRNVAKDVHKMSYYAEPARKYVGKSHLASVRICGDKAYNVRQSHYDSEKFRNDINLLSHYVRNSSLKSQKSQDENSTKSKAVEAVEAVEVPVVDN